MSVYAHLGAAPGSTTSYTTRSESAQTANHIHNVSSLRRLAACHVSLVSCEFLFYHAQDRLRQAAISRR
jgi:hypothetical protein